MLLFTNKQPASKFNFDIFLIWRLLLTKWTKRIRVATPLSHNSSGEYPVDARKIITLDLIFNGLHSNRNDGPSFWDKKKKNIDNCRFNIWQWLKDFSCLFMVEMVCNPHLVSTNVNVYSNCFKCFSWNAHVWYGRKTIYGNRLAVTLGMNFDMKWI